MKTRVGKIQGLLFMDMEVHTDDRGFFARNFCAKSIDASGGYPEVSQANISFNKTKGTVRGFHFQSGGHEEAKTVTVLKGSLHYKVIDLRKNSSTYLEHESFEISALQGVVQVPKGCAPGFQTLEDDVLLHYYVSNPYSSSHESGIRYNDNYFNLKWPGEVTNISDRDKNFPDFNPLTFVGLQG
jgi:dTDP-4-dehydrorhamnose 3,5-epimerase